jgi:ABC-type branched-subunit amino acid transport system substrate-binding protein
MRILNRIFCVALFFFGLCNAGAHAESAESIKLLAPLALSGPLAVTSEELLAGAKVYLAQVNRNGGVRGRQLNLVTVDNPTIDAANDTLARALHDNRDAVAMLLPMQVVSALELIAAERIAAIGPPGGATEEHDADRAPMLYHIKVGWRGEYDKIAEQLSRVGIDRVAFVYDRVIGSWQSNSLPLITQAFMARRIDIKPILLPESGAIDGVFSQVRAAAPQVVVLGLLGDSMLRFLDGYRASHASWPLYSSSLGNLASVRDAVRRAGASIGVAQTLPPFWDRSVPVVREYQDAMTQAGKKDFSYLSLEGYMAAKVAVEALRRTGSRPLNRDAVSNALGTMTNYDLGGVPISFGPDRREGSHYLDLTLLKSDGQYVR